MQSRSLRFVRVPVFVLALATVVVSTPGCSLFAGSHSTLTVTASDPQAEIWIDGAQYGTGVAQADVARNRSHSVMARIGERVGVRTVGRTISTTGILDIVGGVLFLFPLLGLFAAGFWDLEEDNVTVVIPKASSP